jgi:hypothetical protein
VHVVTLTKLPFTVDDLKRLRRIAPQPFHHPEHIRRVIDGLGYLEDWRSNYKIRSVRSSLHAEQITCIDAAILSYGLLELLFTRVKRRLLAIHRRNPQGEECGHCVTLYWNAEGRVGAFSKSSFAGLGHRDAVFPDEHAVARSYADAYMRMDFTPLYFGVTTLEEAAGDLDWRSDPGELNAISERLKERYEYAFEAPR